jgi:hypothetical protein
MIGRSRTWWAPIAASAVLLMLSACVVHERVYYDDDAYRYQHRQLYNDYEYRNSYDYGNQRYQRPVRVYYYYYDYYDDDYYADGYGSRPKD